MGLAQVGASTPVKRYRAGGPNRFFGRRKVRLWGDPETQTGPAAQLEAVVLHVELLTKVSYGRLYPMETSGSLILDLKCLSEGRGCCYTRPG